MPDWTVATCFMRGGDDRERRRGLGLVGHGVDRADHVRGGRERPGGLRGDVHGGDAGVDGLARERRPDVALVVAEGAGRVAGLGDEVDAAGPRDGAVLERLPRDRGGLAGEAGGAELVDQARAGARAVTRDAVLDVQAARGGAVLRAVLDGCRGGLGGLLGLGRPWCPPGLRPGRVGSVLDGCGRVGGRGDDDDVAQLGDLVDVADVAVATRRAATTHPPRAGAQVAALDGLADVGAALGRADGPVQPVGAVLELERGRVAAERDAGVVDGDDEIVELRAVERAGLDDLAPAAEVAGLDAVGDEAADACGPRR